MRTQIRTMQLGTTRLERARLQPPPHAVSRRAGGRWPVAFALLCASLTLAGEVRAAAALCSSAIFQCMDDDGVTHGKNLVVLVHEERRSLSWVLKHCGKPVDRTPYRCDWRRSIKQGQLKGDTASTPAPSSAARDRAGAAARAAVPRPPAGRGPRPSPPRAPEITGSDRSPYAAEIAAAAERYRLPADLIRAVIKIESNFNPKAVSIKGAKGLMQLMPTVAQSVGVADPFDPGPNILGGARLLRILANRFNGDLVKVLSAFHAGSTPVHRQAGTPFASTDNYVRKVLGVYYALRDG